jgi:hypothetical protein
LISVRSEVQILPGPPPNDAQRRSCGCRVSGSAATAGAATPKAAGSRDERFAFALAPATDFGLCPKPWGCSSVGRAPALQAGGRRFDSVHLHHRAKARSALVARRGSGSGATARAPTERCGAAFVSSASAAFLRRESAAADRRGLIGESRVCRHDAGD